MLNWTIKTRRGKLELERLRDVAGRFAAYARPHRFKLAAAALASIGAVTMQVAAPWPIKTIFDYILTDNMADSRIGQALVAVASTPLAALGWVCGAILAIAILDAVFTHLRDVLLAQTGQRVVGKIRQNLFDHLQTLPPSEFERRQTGDLLMRLTGDILVLRQMLVDAVVSAGQSALLIVAMLAAMFWLNPLLAALGVATLPLALYATWRTTRQIRKATNRQRESEGLVASLAHDVLGAMSIVQAFNREAIEHKRFSRKNRSAVRAGVKTTRLESKLYRIISIASAAGLCVILYVGVRSVLNKTMTAGDLLVFISYLRSMHKPMRNIAKLAGQAAKAVSCGERVAEVFAIRPGVANLPDAVELKSVRGDIEMDNVSFKYADGPRALTNVSLAIPAGRRVAIVGHTGAGKSTLAKLLLRFHDPQSGCVRIDGHDLRSVRLESLRRSIGWVHQDTILFGMSVRDNIALGCPEASDGAIQDVALRVQADGFIEALPQGYDTHLGQDGLTLSGGQRQRIALARALLRRAPILVLDEPVTGLDAKTRALVEGAWMSGIDRCVTTLVICHRIQDMERFDRIVVLSQSRIVEVGTHAELLAAGGEYAGLFSAGRDDLPSRAPQAVANGSFPARMERAVAPC